MAPSEKKPPAPAAPPVREVEMEDVVMVPLGKERFRVAVVRLRGVVVAEKVLEASVSLPVARQAALTWRVKNGALSRGLK